MQPRQAPHSSEPQHLAWNWPSLASTARCRRRSAAPPPASAQHAALGRTPRHDGRQRQRRAAVLAPATSLLAFAPSLLRQSSSITDDAVPLGPWLLTSRLIIPSSVDVDAAPSTRRRRAFARPHHPLTSAVLRPLLRSQRVLLLVLVTSAPLSVLALLSPPLSALLSVLVPPLALLCASAPLCVVPSSCPIWLLRAATRPCSLSSRRDPSTSASFWPHLRTSCAHPTGG
jgi:hypothetical protein